MDGLGSITDLTDPSQAVIEQYQYDAFGIMQTPPATGNIYTYTGREYDAETGLYYYRARYYNAQAGRFVTVDPVEKEYMYYYCSNNPIVYIDPFGLWLEKLAPNYGNYGGHNWSGGKKVKEGELGLDVEPVDELDRCFKKHDNCYFKHGILRREPQKDCEKQKAMDNCDADLGDCLADLGKQKPSEWKPKPATKPKWAERYRRGAASVFESRKTKKEKEYTEPLERYIINNYTSPYPFL
jgi:RHS repeat-associated protein